MALALRSSLLIVSAVALAALAGCSARAGGNVDLVTGKKLFVSKCGSCHVLAHAGTKGTQGPNLDDALANPVAEGFGESAIRGLVDQQIAIARKGGIMPAGLVKGQDAQDVAAYVASVVAQPGKDSGLLASVGQAAQSTKPAVETNGAISIPADPNGQLLYSFKSATGTAGQITIEMPNKSSTGHDIVIDGKGKGEIASGGATSKFTATFAPGKYTFYCSVPGHRQAGMQGTLTVK